MPHFANLTWVEIFQITVYFIQTTLVTTLLIYHKIEAVFSEICDTYSAYIKTQHRNTQNITFTSHHHTSPHPNTYQVPTLDVGSARGWRSEDWGWEAEGISFRNQGELTCFLQNECYHNFEGSLLSPRFIFYCVTTKTYSKLNGQRAASVPPAPLPAVCKKQKKSFCKFSSSLSNVKCNKMQRIPSFTYKFRFEEM